MKTSRTVLGLSWVLLLFSLVFLALWYISTWRRGYTGIGQLDNGPTVSRFRLISWFLEWWRGEGVSVDMRVVCSGRVVLEWIRRFMNLWDMGCHFASTLSSSSSLWRQIEFKWKNIMRKRWNNLKNSSLNAFSIQNFANAFVYPQFFCNKIRNLSNFLLGSFYFALI